MSGSMLEDYMPDVWSCILTTLLPYTAIFITVALLFQQAPLIWIELGSMTAKPVQKPLIHKSH